MSTSTLPAPGPAGSRFKTVLWILLGLTTLFVFVTSEVLLVTDYPMYHAYRLQVIADRGLLIPHTLCGTVLLALSAAPHEGPSSPGPHVFCLSHTWRLYRDRPCCRASGPARDRHARGRLDHLHDRSRDCRAQPSDLHTSTVDGPFVRGHIYLRLESCSESSASLLEPPG